MHDKIGQPETTLAQARAALKTAQARIEQLELAVEMSECLVNAGSFQMAWDTMRVTWSANNLRLFGVTEEAFGKTYTSITDFIHPDDRASFDKMMERVMVTREPYSHRHRIIRSDGEIRHVREVAATAGGPTGNHFFGVTQDITELVEAKAAEAEMQSMIQLAGELAKLGGWALDTSTGMVELSPVTAQLHDLPDVRRMPMIEAFGFYTEESAARIKAAVALSIENRVGFDETLTMVSATGARRQVRVIVQPVLCDDGARLVRLKGAMQDVSELQLQRSRAEHSDNLLRIAGASAKFGGWRYDVGTAALEWSSQTARMHDEPDGFTPSVAEGVAYYVPEHRDRIATLFQSCLDLGEPFDETLQLISAKGRRFWVRATGEVERNEAGKIVGVRGSIQDNEDLIKAQNRAEDADRLLEIAGQAVKLGGWSVSLADHKVFWSDVVARIHELPAGTMPTFDGGIEYFAPEEREDAQRVFKACAIDGIHFDSVRNLITAKGNRIKVRTLGEPVRDNTGKIIAVQGAMQDVTDVMAMQAENAMLAFKVQEMIDGLPDAFLFLDKDFCLTYANHHAEAVLGATSATMFGQDFGTRFPGLANTRFIASAREAIVSRKTLQVTEQIDSLGRTFAISVYPADHHVAILMRDMTEDVARADQLNLLETAVSRLNDIILITKAEPFDAPNGPVIVYVNDAFVRRTGFSREEAIGKSPRILQGPKTQRSELDKIRSALVAWEPVRAELINYTKAGEEFWLELDIVPIADEKGLYTHWVAVERDITDRKHADEKMRLNDERFRLMSAATSDVVWDCDLETDETWWGENITTQFGYRFENEKSSGSWVRENTHAEDREAVRDSFRAAIDGTCTTWHSQYRVHRANGSIATVLEKGFIIRNLDGKAVRVIGAMTDITGQLMIDAQLQQAQKLEAVGRLTGGVAHDFNNLLTVILGNAEDLCNLLPDEPHLQIMAEMTMTAAQRGAELTNRLLAFSRKQPLEPKSVDVNQLVKGMDGMLRRVLPESVDIMLIKGAGLWSGYLDAGQMETALLNLAINARDAMVGHGHLTIETSNAYIDDDYANQHDEVKSGAYVLISVTDTGCGMDLQTLEQVFDPFFTTKQVGEGSGLGLSMVYGYIKQSGGHIKIYSEVNVGTTVKLYIPRAATAKTLATSQLRPTVTQGNGEHILVVEDDDLVRHYLEIQLRNLNYRVSIADSGPAALVIIQASDDLDLLFTDVVMPGGMNGRELADAARVIRPELRVLYTSGYTENAIVHQGRLDVGVELLSKPYRRQELEAKLNKIFGNKREV
jgi:PAS domain S-box-containing protein